MIALPAWDLTRWLVEIAGWGGAVLILLAYLLLSAGKNAAGPFFDAQSPTALPPSPPYSGASTSLRCVSS